MNLLEAIILGIVQGLTEFLPVSSSGHLVLLQRVFNINEPSLFFDTMLHLGTLTAVFVVLWKDIWELIKKPIQKLTLFIIIATIPAVIAALTFSDTIEEIFVSADFLGICFLITAALLVTAEILSKRAKRRENLKEVKDMHWLHALLIGVMQAIAIPPGISRSGATISGALFCKLDREAAARFSFLMSIPAILGAVVLQTKDLISNNAANIEYSISAAAVVAGTVTSAIVGFFAVKFMLKIIKERSLYSFAVYTGILGICVIFDQLVSHFVFK
jgi:undecaprenyl-diphosphatase